MKKAESEILLKHIYHCYTKTYNFEKRFVISYLKSQSVDLIKKKDNAPNVPQEIGIEKFWALCTLNVQDRLNGSVNSGWYGKILATKFGKSKEKL